MTKRNFKPSDFVCRGGAAPTNGTCLQGEFTMSPAALRELLGPPGEGDGYKVAFEWVLIGPSGVIATIYDWKGTLLYDDDLPSPAEFMQGGSLYNAPLDWHIGGHGPEATRFVHELLNIQPRGGR